jgi:hypothetical protein
MNATRRTAVLLGLTAAVVVGTSIPASATFSAGSTAVAAKVGTLTVAPPTALVVDDSCTTVTTTVTQTVHTDPATGVQTTRSHESSTTRTPSASNDQGTTTETVPGPGADEATTTTVTTNTELSVTLSWAGSPSRGVDGYVVSAQLGPGGPVMSLVTTGSATTSVGHVQDADVLGYQPSLRVTARTSYRWTADSAFTRVLAC